MRQQAASSCPREIIAHARRRPRRHARPGGDPVKCALAKLAHGGQPDAASDKAPARRHSAAGGEAPGRARRCFIGHAAAAGRVKWPTFSSIAEAGNASAKASSIVSEAITQASLDCSPFLLLSMAASAHRRAARTPTSGGAPGGRTEMTMTALRWPASAAELTANALPRSLRQLRSDSSSPPIASNIAPNNGRQHIEQRRIEGGQLSRGATSAP